MSLAAAVGIWPFEQLVSIGSHAATTILVDRLFALFEQPRLEQRVDGSHAMLQHVPAQVRPRTQLAAAFAHRFAAYARDAPSPGPPPRINAHRGNLRIELPPLAAATAESLPPLDLGGGDENAISGDERNSQGRPGVLAALKPSVKGVGASALAEASQASRRRPGTYDHEYPVHFMMAVANSGLVLAKVPTFRVWCRVLADVVPFSTHDIFMKA